MTLATGGAGGCTLVQSVVAMRPCTLNSTFGCDLASPEMDGPSAWVAHGCRGVIACADGTRSGICGVLGSSIRMRCSCSSNRTAKEALNTVARRKASRLSTDLTGAYASGDACPSSAEEPACGVRLIANAEGSRCQACDYGLHFGCSDTSRIWVKSGCRGRFSCAPDAMPFWCGQSNADQNCDCTRVGDFCGQVNAVRAAAAGAFATANSLVPSYYMRAVYGASAAAANAKLPLHQQLRLGALELLYSTMSVPTPLPGAGGATGGGGLHTPTDAKGHGEGSEVHAVDMVQTVVTGRCFAFTGGGDMHCCHGGLVGGATYATSQGHLVYNPLCVRTSFSIAEMGLELYALPTPTNTLALSN